MTVSLARSDMPDVMADARRWVRWRRVVRNGRETKIPLTVAGRAASSTDPTTWHSLTSARSSGVGHGIGFALGDGIVCLDLDHCLIDGTPTPAAQRLLDALPATFVEVSPGGDGLHVFGYGALPRGRRINFDGLAVEAYASGRYITVTGHRYRDAPATLADLSGILEALGVAGGERR